MAGITRRYLLAAFGAISIYALLAYNFHSTYLPRIPDAVHDFWSNLGHGNSSIPPLVNGPPTVSFRDNLRNDTRYITSWISAGWSESRFRDHTS